MRIKLTTKDRERFEAKVDRSGGADACHPWMAYRHGGYGKFSIGGRMERAHRVAWVLFGNEITKEKPCILHNCPDGDNRACCNPRHLWAGTKGDNLLDMARKGRGRTGRPGLPFGVNLQPSGRFRARAWVDGRIVHLGIYDTVEEAGVAALNKKTKWLSGRGGASCSGAK